jgi:galactose mutarotase-like enzyme
VVELAAGPLRAAFAPDAGLVCCSLTHEGEELLGQRGGLDAWRERGKTMGIPLLAPWANRLDEPSLTGTSPLVRPDEHGLPIHGLLHGFARWEVVEHDPTRLVGRLDFGADAERLRLFPYPHALRVEARLDPHGLTIQTHLTATGDVAVPVSFGWHPYLVLPGVPRAQWEIHVSARQRMPLDERGLPTGAVVEDPVAAGPLGERTFDDAFARADGAVAHLRGGGRTIAVVFAGGYTHAQLFAPPGEDVVAFEPMTAPANALKSGDGLRHVQPGDRFAATFRVAVG